MRIPRTEYIGPPAEVLPVVGPLFEFPWGTEVISFYITYTQDAAVDGEVQMSFEIGNGTDIVRTIIVDTASLVISTSFGTVDAYVERLNGPPIVGGAGAIPFLVRICPKMGERTIRVSFAEVGTPGTPGTVLVTLTGGGPQQ